ncbi:MerR family transcriptional regulator [Furfurilactobacillus curtus]|uniref:MerR family transcriptional regulator n=1 Tax=Furfurilactobacillus curtus TaxID=1746200 RepID=A0ABQ5JPS6_9LACO
MNRPSLRESNSGHIFSTEKLIFGIGEISRMTGVSTRQLRYWETKGYINSKDRQDEQQQRVYGYATFLKVSGIKTMLDEGYTLAAASAQTDALIQEGLTLRNFVLDAYHGLEEINGRMMLDLGDFDDAGQLRLYAYVEDHHVHYQQVLVSKDRRQ